MAVPAGDHTIEFRFEPKSYIMGNRLSVWAAIIIYLFLITAALQIFGIISPKPKAQSPKPECDLVNNIDNIIVRIFKNHVKSFRL